MVVKVVAAQAVLSESQPNLLDWLSQVSSYQDPSSDHKATARSELLHPSSGTSPSSGKRKRAAKHTADPSTKRQCRTETSTQPLTRRALKQLTASMSPPHQDLATASGTNNKKTTTVTSISKATPKEPDNVQNVRQSLADHLMHFNNVKAFEKYPALRLAVDEILAESRHSTVKDESAKAVKHQLVENATASEATVYPELVAAVLKKSHTVESTAHREVEFIQQSYDNNGLIHVKDANFLKWLMPCPMEAKLEKSLGLLDSKPDYVYGMKTPRHPEHQGPDDHVKAIIGVCSGLRHPCLAIKNVSCENPIAVAENQCIRDGATMVNARRILNRMAEAANHSEGPGADISSINFSCAWALDTVKLFVHWAEVGDDKPTIFHMNPVGKFDLESREGLACFRRCVHNIWDWGIYKNTPAAEKVVAEIVGGQGQAAANPYGRRRG